MPSSGPVFTGDQMMSDSRCIVRTVVHNARKSGDNAFFVVTVPVFPFYISSFVNCVTERDVTDKNVQERILILVSNCKPINFLKNKMKTSMGKC
jgi:hypothetical protein